MVRLISMAVALFVLTLAVVVPRAQSQPDGLSIFRFDTFGSEQLWSDFLEMQDVISQNVSPRTALSVGLKWTRRLCHQR